jgi:endonuclease/exonuclease/phosphatase family metal-dependent hydrolase
MTTSNSQSPRWPRWRRRLAEISAVLTAVILWQGAVRTPTATPVEGESLNPSSAPQLVSRDRVLHVATYNIAGGVGADGKQNLARTAEVIGRRDLVGLEEIHGGGLLGGADQAEILGFRLKMPWLFVPSERRWWRDSFGNGILFDLPVTHWRRDRLSTTLASTNRTLLTATVQWQGQAITVLITHLDRGDDHDMELGAVLAAFDDAPPPKILLADLNTTADHPLLARFRAEAALTDPLGPIAPPGDVDWIFAKGLTSVAAGFTKNDASDHSIAWADLSLAGVR